MNKDFYGVYALLCTPFNEDRSIDLPTYEKYVEWQAQRKPQHLFAVCGSSEMSQMKLDERVLLAKTAVERSGGIPVVATGNLEPSWYAQIDEVKRMEATGVSALVFVTKGYCDDSDRLITYLCELAGHTTLPVLLYEYPGMQPCHMDGETYGRLVETGRFFGIKDTTCTMPLIEEKIARQGESAVLQANIPYLFEAYKAGARGVMATTTVCGAHLFVKMWDEFTNGNLDAAEKTHRQICVLDDALEGGFSATAKYLISRQGCQMNWYTRGNHNLNAQKLKSLDVFFDYAKDNGIF